MKTLRYTLALLLGVAATVGVQAANKNSSSDAASRVEVVFEQPEKFTDAADGPRGTTFGLESNLAEIKDYIVSRASSVLAPDQRLKVTITDVDLAGEIEPWRSARAQDIRIVKDIYYPRIDLTFQLTDASGAVIKEGKRELRDMNFSMKLHTDRSDPRLHEKGLLDDWIRSEFRTKK